MLEKIIGISIRNKLIVGLFTLSLVVVGVYSVTQLPIDALPDITNNQVQVLTVSPSLAAEDIERLVTFPVEQTMATIPGIEEIRSLSRFGLSVVTIVFKEDIDIYWARQQVNERLVAAKTLIPQDAGIPELAPLTTGLGEIYQYALSLKPGYEKKYSAMDLRTIQDWIVRRQLLGTEGVADVSSFGGYLKQYEIAVDPEKLHSLHVSIPEIFAALQKNNQNTGGAYIDKKPNAYFIRSEGLIRELGDLERIVIKNNPNGIPVLMRHVAQVNFGHAIRYGAMTRNDEGEVVGGIVLMLKGANSSKVIGAVKDRISQIEKSLPEGVSIEPFLDRTKLVNNAIHTVTKNLAEGALIVIFVLVLLLGNFRAGLIVASVIPLAMLFAITMMNFFGVSGNLMSLGAIDFGLIVDGAVIIVEATLHHMTVRRLLPGAGNSRLTQSEMDGEVHHSASRIMSAAAFGEIIILIVYLPILALVGTEGKMFRPMAQTVSFAIIGAFLLSLTYVPMIAALFLSKRPKEPHPVSQKTLKFFHRVYEPMIQFALRRKKTVIISALLAFVLSLWLFMRMGGEFIPTLDEGDFAVETRVLKGSSISQTTETALRAAKLLKQHFPEVKEVIGKIGSSEIPTDPMPVEACDLIVILKNREEWTSAESREELADKMSQTLHDLPGVTFSFQQPIQMRFNELMTGARQDVVIKIFGENLDRLTEYANKMGKIAASIPGAEDVFVEPVTGQPQIVIQFDRDRIAQFGLNIEDINRTIRTGFAGDMAGFVYEGEKRFDLAVRLEKNRRHNLEDIRNLFITGPSGQQIPLAQLASVDLKMSVNQVQREDTKRRVMVGFNVRGRDVETVVNDIQKAVNQQLKMDAGYYVTYGGTFRNLIEARQRLAVAVPVALLLILVLLFFTFRSIKQSLLIFTAIPFSAIGGVLALWLRGMPFSISAGVGFIALFGVAVLNGIVLIAEFNRLKQEGISDMKELILKGTSTRLRPVIMTALVASLGFLPMAISQGSGAEVQRPLATVVIGGLVTATLLTLLVLPVLYWLSERIGASKKVPLLGIALLFVSLIPFQGSAQSQVLTLNDAMAQALKSNPGRMVAVYELDQSKALSRTASDIGKTNVTLLYGQYNSQYKDNNVTVSQTFPFPTVIGAQKNWQEAGVKAGELKVQMTENELLFQVKSVYRRLQYLKAFGRLLQEEDSLYSDFRRAAVARFKAGEASLLEKTTAETQALEMKNILANHQTNFSIAETQLQVLLNSTGSVEPESLPVNKPQWEQEGDSSAFSSNPGLQYFQQQAELGNRLWRVERARVMPDITLGYFNQSLTGYQNIYGSDQYFGPNKRFTGFSVGVSLPIWFRPQLAKVKAASLGQKVAQTQADYFQKNLQGQFKEAYLDYLQLKNTLSYYENQALPNAELIIKQSRKAFAGGEISYVEYLHGLRAALTIREAYLSYLNSYYQSIVKLEFLSGKK